MLANLQDGIISDELPYLKEIDSKYEKYCIKNGSLVISKNASLVKMAIVSVQEGKKILANGNLYVIELDTDKINPYFFKSVSGKRKWKGSFIQSCSRGYFVKSTGGRIKKGDNSVARFRKSEKN